MAYTSVNPYTGTKLSAKQQSVYASQQKQLSKSKGTTKTSEPVVTTWGIPSPPPGWGKVSVKEPVVSTGGIPSPPPTGYVPSTATTNSIEASAAASRASSGSSSGGADRGNFSSTTVNTKSSLYTPTSSGLKQTTNTPTRAPSSTREVYENRDNFLGYDDKGRPMFRYGEYDIPGFTKEGLPDPKYTPQTRDEIFDRSDIDAYTRQRWLANWYKAQGLDFNPEDFPVSFEEEAKGFLKDQAEQKTILQRQVDAAKNQAKEDYTRGTSAVQSRFSVTREGITSASNVEASRAIRGTMSRAYGQQIESLNQKMEELDYLQEQQRKNYVESREDQILQLRAVVANAQAEIVAEQNQRREQSMNMLKMLQENDTLGYLDEDSLAYIEEGLADVPSGIVRALGIASRAAINQKLQKESFEQSYDLISLLDDAGALANLDTESMAYIQAGMPGLPDGIVQAIGLAATRSSLKEDQKEAFDQYYKSFEIAKKLADMTGTVHVPGVDGQMIDTGMPTVDLYKFKDGATRDMMRISLTADKQRNDLAMDLLDTYGGSAAPYVEALTGISGLGGMTLEEMRIAVQRENNLAKQDQFLMDYNYKIMNDEALKVYDSLKATVVKSGIQGLNPLSLPDVRSTVLNNSSSITQGFKAPGTGGTDRDGGHRGVDYVSKDGISRALRSGYVIGINKDTGPTGWGNQVYVMDDTGLIWQYSHLGLKDSTDNPFAVQIGEYINVGDAVGQEGNTGHVRSEYTGPTAGRHTDIRIVGRLTQERLNDVLSSTTQPLTEGADWINSFAANNDKFQGLGTLAGTASAVANVTAKKIAEGAPSEQMSIMGETFDLINEWEQAKLDAGKNKLATDDEIDVIKKYGKEGVEYLKKGLNSSTGITITPELQQLINNAE